MNSCKTTFTPLFILFLWGFSIYSCSISQNTGLNSYPEDGIYAQSYPNQIQRQKIETKNNTQDESQNPQDAEIRIGRKYLDHPESFGNASSNNLDTNEFSENTSQSSDKNIIINNYYNETPNWGVNNSWNNQFCCLGNHFSFGWGWNSWGYNNWGWNQPWIGGWGWNNWGYNNWGWNNGWGGGWNNWGYNNWGWNQLYRNGVPVIYHGRNRVERGYISNYGNHLQNNNNNRTNNQNSSRYNRYNNDTHPNANTQNNGNYNRYGGGGTRYENNNGGNTNRYDNPRPIENRYGGNQNNNSGGYSNRGSGGYNNGGSYRNSQGSRGSEGYGGGRTGGMGGQRR